MRKLFFSAVLTGSMCAVSLTSSAQRATIGERQVNQQGRIQQGARSGELTRGETRRLENEQRGVQAEKKAARADGHVTPAERTQIRHDQNRTSRDIARAKHNPRVR